MIRFFTAALLLVTLLQPAQAQDDLLSELSKDDKQSADPVLATFNGTRIINGHSVETKPKGALEFIITHRFGTLNSGGYNMWGLDDAFIRIGLEYAITDRLGIGYGRSSVDKTYDYYLKYKLLQQQEGMPVTVTAFGSASYNASMNVTFPELKTSDKMSYVAQAHIARKFSDRLSLQVSPTYLHRNTVDQDIASNDLLALGFGGRVKVSKIVALVGEYYLRLNEKSENPFNNSMGLGIEFDTGGHIFHLVFTNSRGMVERPFLAETEGDFFDGDIHFGFNITRTFQLAGKK
jgi:hypothetical protein